jgi:GDPmannose 4,6-dehydratase
VRHPLQPRVAPARRDLRHPQDHPRRRRIKLGLQDKLFLGNLDSKRDWGFAGDYVKAMWLMLQQDKPDDYVVATGKTITVREFCELAFGHVGWTSRTTSPSTRATCAPPKSTCSWATPPRPSAKLGWVPTTTVEQLAAMMVEHDLEMARREKTLRDAGHKMPEFAGHDQ